MNFCYCLLTIKHIENQLEKLEEVDHVYLAADNTLYIHVDGEEPVEGSDMMFEVNDAYFSWLCGDENAFNTASMMLKRAIEYYHK